MITCLPTMLSSHAQPIGGVIWEYLIGCTLKHSSTGYRNTLPSEWTSLTKRYPRITHDFWNIACFSAAGVASILPVWERGRQWTNRIENLAVFIQYIRKWCNITLYSTIKAFSAIPRLWKAQQSIKCVFIRSAIEYPWCLSGIWCVTNTLHNAFKKSDAIHVYNFKCYYHVHIYL